MKLCARLFDVMKMKNMYGKQVRGVERSTFLIDPKGTLIAEWRKVKVPGHALEGARHPETEVLGFDQFNDKFVGWPSETDRKS